MITEKMLREAVAEANRALVQQWEERQLEEHSFSKGFDWRMKGLIHKNKYRRAYQILKQAACLFLMLLIGCTSVLTVHVEAREAVFDWFKRYMFVSDAKYLVQKVEDIHPCFVLDAVPEDYEMAREQYLKAVRGETVDEKVFEIETMRYLASLNDISTGIKRTYSFQRLLDIDPLYENGETWLQDKNGADSRLVSIGGVAVETIWTVIDELTPTVNESVSALYVNFLCCDDVLQLSGVDVSGNEVEVLVERQGRSYSQTYPFISYEAYFASKSSVQEEKTVSYEKLEDVFYVDMNTCVVDSDLKTTIAALQDAVNSGTTKVIIDVRGNTGGNSVACELLLEAMEMKLPAYTVYSRTTGTDVYRVEDPNTATSYQGAVPNPHIDLMVLCDEKTGGSATVLCVWVQDGDLGYIVGSPCCTSPNSYGYNPEFTLPNTDTKVHISCKYWERPDQNANPDVLEMDILLSHGEDALEVALEMLAE